eukprot:m.96143 g.96143  ORF g.96143 m.96143 type:complete len:440 (-) comp15477_c0_seq1:715-2034(-)
MLTTLLLVSLLAAGTLGAESPYKDDSPLKQAVGAGSPFKEPELVLLDPEIAQATGALCLDGTPPGFYYAPANTDVDPSAATKWVVYIQGGGWCYTLDDCLARANTSLGSSKFFGKTFGTGEGPFSSNPLINPEFVNYHRVGFAYCDGASFSGNADEPVVVRGTPLYFRGHRILVELFGMLHRQFGMDQGTHLLVTGCSAGGLSTFLHADYIRDNLFPAGGYVKAMPISGFFLLHDDGNGNNLYPDQMKNVVAMQNATGGLHQGCVASLPADEQWRCIFANYSYAHTTTPMFVLNSALDSWQLYNIYTVAASFSNCSAPYFPDCSASNIAVLNKYAQDFSRDLQSLSVYSQNGNGAFIDMCFEHCAGEGSGWAQYSLALQGQTSPRRPMFQAADDWWRQPPSSTPAKLYNYLADCLLNKQAPHQCQASCCPPSQKSFCSP